MFCHQVGIIYPECGPLGDILQKGDPFFAHLGLPLDVGYNIDFFYCFQGSLGICVEYPDRVHFVVKKIDTTRVTGGIGKYISDSTPDSILSGFMHKIDQLKIICLHHLFQEGHIDLLPLPDLQSGLSQLPAGDHRFHQRLGIGYYEAGYPSFRKPSERLCTGDDIGLISLLVLHGSFVRGGKKEGPVGRSIQRNQVGIEIGSFLFILE